MPKTIVIELGQRYGKLTIIREVPQGSLRNRRCVECLCDCGSVRTVRLMKLRAGRVTQCKKCAKVDRMIAIVPGQRYGKLTILREVSRTVTCRLRRVEYRCDCGRVGQTQINALRAAKATSCAICARSRQGGRTHGEAWGRHMTPEYNVWRDMKNRCLSVKHESWSDYGGRGITVCERWIKSYPAFLDDMGRRPSPKHSIDRKNNDGNYEKDNCKWSTKREQDRNKRSNVWVTRNGIRMVLTDACREAGLARTTVEKRINHKWQEGRWFDPPDVRYRHPRKKKN